MRLEYKSPPTTAEARRTQRVAEVLGYKSHRRGAELTELRRVENMISPVGGFPLTTTLPHGYAGEGVGLLPLPLAGEGWGEGGSSVQGLRQRLLRISSFLLSATPRSLRLCGGELTHLN